MVAQAGTSQGTGLTIRSFTLVPGLVGVARAELVTPANTETGSGSLELLINYGPNQSNRYPVYFVPKTT